MRIRLNSIKQITMLTRWVKLTEETNDRERERTLTNTRRFGTAEQNKH